MGKISACPQNQAEVTNASESLGCKDKYGNNQYMCLPETEKSSFIEFCYDGLMGLKEKGNCLEVSNGSLVFRSCKQFIFGCPNEAIRSQEYYRYKACLAIDFRNHCYKLDPSCPPEPNGNNGTVFNASKNNTVLNISENTDSDAIIYSCVFGSIIILLFVIITSFVIYKIRTKKGRRKRNRRQTIDQQGIDEVECINNDVLLDVNSRNSSTLNQTIPRSITFTTLSSDVIHKVEKGATIQDIRKSVAKHLETDYWHIDIVNMENYFIYDPDITSDVLHDPFYVMVGAFERPSNGQITTAKPDIVWEYESNPRIVLSCGHAITPANLYGVIRDRILQNDYRLFCPGKTDFGKCDQEWDSVTVLKQCALSPDEYLFFSGKLSFNYLNKRSNDDAIKQCPRCGSFSQRTRITDSHVKCLMCANSTSKTYEFCWDCLKTWTPDHTCSITCGDNVEIQKQLRECSRMTLDYSNMRGVPSKRLCPNCKALIQLNQACKSMLCIHCKTEFCFACLQIATHGKLSCGEMNQRCVVAPIQSTD